MNILKIILFAILLLIIVPQQAQAGGNCTQFYGGGYTGTQTCAKITLDKKVLKPGTKDYVDGLSMVDAKYHSSDKVVFQIVVQNTGSEDLNNVVLTDTLPQYVTFVSGPGSFDAKTNKLTLNISTLKIGESQTYYLETKVVDNITFNNNGAVCTTNSVRVDVKDKASAEDNAQFCIERILKVEAPVKGLKETPPTGPADAALAILISMAGAGMYLKSKTQKMLNKRGGVTK